MLSKVAARRTASALCALALLASCAGRDPVPVQVAQASDNLLACSQITAEMQANETKVRQLADEEASKKKKNIAIGAVGALLFWPALFAMDFSGAEKTEIEALRARQAHLTQLQARACDEVKA